MACHNSSWISWRSLGAGGTAGLGVSDVISRLLCDPFCQRRLRRLVPLQFIGQKPNDIARLGQAWGADLVCAEQRDREPQRIGGAGADGQVGALLGGVGAGFWGVADIAVRVAEYGAHDTSPCPIG